MLSSIAAHSRSLRLSAEPKKGGLGEDLCTVRSCLLPSGTKLHSCLWHVPCSSAKSTAISSPPQSAAGWHRHGTICTRAAVQAFCTSAGPGWNGRVETACGTAERQSQVWSGGAHTPLDSRALHPQMVRPGMRGCERSPTCSSHTGRVDCVKTEDPLLMLSQVLFLA